MTAIDKSKWDRVNSTGYRVSGYEKHGVTGNRVTPTPYMGYGGVCNPKSVIYNGPPATSFFDIPNVSPIYYASVDPRGQFGDLINASWERLVDKVRDGPASLGETIVQSGQAFEMIANRFGIMYHAYQALRKGRFAYFLRELRTKPMRKHRSWVRSSVGEASNHWLEYYFGWLPLIQDVYDSAHILTKTPPSGQSFRGRAGRNYHRVDANYPEEKSVWNGVDMVTQGGRFQIDNPNLFLLQQVGLANPAQLAWNLLPFSFLVDWVFDVSSFIGGYSDMLGLKIVDPYTTYYRRARNDYRRGGYYPPEPYWHLQTCKVYYTKRLTSLSKPHPNTHVLMNLGTSMKRAATAASLLGQILTKG